MYLTSIKRPGSLQFIGGGAFNGCPLLTVMVTEGSYAHEYSEGKGLPCEFID